MFAIIPCIVFLSRFGALRICRVLFGALRVCRDDVGSGELFEGLCPGQASNRLVHGCIVTPTPNLLNRLFPDAVFAAM